MVIAGGGKGALALRAQNGKFDLILCELMMPDMTGMTVHEKLRVLDPALARRMVSLTGGAFTDNAWNFLDDATLDHIEQPVDTANLRTAVERHLKANKESQSCR